VREEVEEASSLFLFARHLCLLLHAFVRCPQEIYPANDVLMMMLAMNALNVLVLVAWAAVLLWLIGFALTVRGLRRQQPLQSAASDRVLMSADAPLVSVLVPARNEEGRVLHACISSILSQDYGRFEVVAVNDRSVDATGPILHAIAKADARLRVIDGAEPPPGWLGKPHALQQAFQQSAGEWVLATDADMIFAPQALRTAIAHALDNFYDAVTLIPHIVCLTFWERVFTPIFGWYMVMVAPVHRVNNPRKRESLGIGGFFLIRREWLGRVGAYGALRAEVAEDLRMAELLKLAGARLRIEYAPDLISTRMQPTFRDIWEGFSKNLFAGTKFSLFQSFVGGLGILLATVMPLVAAVACAIALWAGAPAWLMQLFVPLMLVWAIQVALFAYINLSWNIPVAYAFAAPLGHALFVAILFNSAFKIASGSGVTWKGRKLYERRGVRPPREGRST
jgi:cellulose synthase/poly-beta-1,6-N-acetylglucosamine synthase-like glycosyltransferase